MFPIRSSQERGQEYMGGDKKEAKVRLDELKADIWGSHWFFEDVYVLYMIVHVM